MSRQVHTKSKYHTLVSTIKERIAAKEFRPGDQIPTLEQLCLRYHVSHITARHAIDLLVQDGTLYRVQGKGTFVSTPSQPLRTIALVMPHLFNQAVEDQYDQGFAIPLIHTIEATAREHNANIMLYLANDEITKERENLQNLLERHPDGAIVFYFGGEANIDMLEQLQASDIPLVLIDRYPQNWPGSFVVTDNYTGACQLVTALIERGFTNTYYFALRDEVSSNNDRLAGYLSAMRSHHLPTDSLIRQLTVHLPSLEISGVIEEMTQEIIATTSPPYAFFSAGPQITTGIWNAVQCAGVAPHEVGIACFDRPPIDLPPETVFVLAEQPFTAMGEMGVQLVMDQINGIDGQRRIILPPTVQTTHSAVRHHRMRIGK